MTGNTRFLLLWFCAGLFIIQPIAADLMVPSITHVYFTDGNGPVKTPVHYTVECFGYHEFSAYGPVTTPAPRESYSPQLVFRYTASCLAYGCTIYEPYYHLDRVHTEWCNLRGESGSGNFSLSNFSTRPYTWIMTVPTTINNEPGKDYSNYFLTPEYSACRGNDPAAGCFFYRWRQDVSSNRVFISCDPATEAGCISLFAGLDPVREVLSDLYCNGNSSPEKMSREQLMQYLDSCDPLTDSRCGGWIIDGKPAKTIPNLMPFAHAASPKRDPCDRFLINASEAVMVPVNMTTSTWVPQGNLALELYELRVTIPQSTTLVQEEGNRFSASYVPESFIEALYCTLFRFFGGSC